MTYWCPQVSLVPARFLARKGFIESDQRRNDLKPPKIYSGGQTIKSSHCHFKNYFQRRDQ